MFNKPWHVNFYRLCVYNRLFLTQLFLLALNRRFCIFIVCVCVFRQLLFLFFTLLFGVCALRVYFQANKSKCISINKYWFGTKTHFVTHMHTTKREYLSSSSNNEKTLIFDLNWFVSMCCDILLLLWIKKTKLKLISKYSIKFDVGEPHPTPSLLCESGIAWEGFFFVL